MSKDPVKTEPVKEAQSWDDKMAAALPQKASFFDAIRTKPFMNLNIVANYVDINRLLVTDPGFRDYYSKL